LVPQPRADETAAKGTQVQNTLTADLGGSRNPDGMMLTIGGFRKWIQGTDEQGMPSQYVQAGANLGVTPAYAKASVYADWGPLIFATIRMEYALYDFFGTNSAPLSFPDARARFGQQELKELKGQEEIGTGHRILLQPALYAMAGPVIFMNRTDLAYYRFDGNRPYFFDWEYEMLFKNGDSAFVNRTQFLIPAWRDIPGLGFRDRFRSEMRTQIQTKPIPRSSPLVKQTASPYHYFIPSWTLSIRVMFFKQIQ
jgi:hypothetical protein